MTDIDKSHNSKFHDDPQFQSLLVRCLEALQRGEQIDADSLAAENPKYADEIRRFLDDRGKLEAIAAEFSGENHTGNNSSGYEPTMDSRAASSGWSPGDTVRYIGEYEILEEIARGGMGIVFKARQAKLNRIVALKMILSGKLADATDVERFHREARAAGRLKHPSIVPVHDVGEHEGRHYFTMDFVDGRSLAEELREESLAPRRAAALLRNVAEAVHFAHQQGTVHRDLKPANILLTADRTPHITDFGLAKLMDAADEDSRAELTASGQILGTPSYMSPEQASGKQQLVGPASDIYSLGAILYACLTGRAPFVADSAVDTLLQVIRNEPVAPRTLNPSIPRDLETICLKCLTKEPHKRYGTAEELADDLQRFLDGRPVVARPVGPVTRYYRWCQRNPVIAALSVLLFASMALGTSVATNFAIEADRRADLEQQQRRRADQQAELATKAENDAIEALRKEKLAHQTAEVARARTAAAMSAEAKSRQQAEAALKAETEARRDAETARAQAELALTQEAESRIQAERAKRDVVRSLYVARTHLTRLLWERGNKWGASLPHIDQFFNNDLTFASPDPELELETLNHMISANPSDDFLHFLRGVYYAKRRQWKEAFADLELSSNLTSGQYWYHCEAASVALMVEDYELYDRHVQSLMKHSKEFEEEGDVLSGANVALIASLRPQTPGVLVEMLPFTQRWAGSRSSQFFRMKSLILVRLRLGEYETVIRLLEPFTEKASFKRPEHEVLAGGIRALAFHRLGRFEEAKQQLGQAQANYADNLIQDFDAREGSLQATHHPFIQAHVLLREAKNQIENDEANGSLSGIPAPIGSRDIANTIGELDTEDSTKRIKMLQELADLGADAVIAVPQLIELLDQPDSLEKAWAIHCLGRIGPGAAAAAPKLHEILKANGEGEYKDAKAVPSLSLLMHGRPSVETIRFGAAAALVRMGPAGKVAMPSLIEMLKNPGESAKTYLKRRKLGSPEAEGYAALLYRSDDEGTYTDARDQYLSFLIGCLATFGPAAKEALPAIEAVKNNPDTLPIVREMAEDAIKRISADGTEVTEAPGS